MRTFSVSFENVSVSALQDLFELTPADDRVVELLGIYLANVGADVGDAAEEMLRLSIIRGHTTGGSGGTAPTPRPMGGNDGAAAAAAEVNNTTIASAGTAVTLHADGMNVRVPYQLIFPPEMRPRCSQSEGVLVVRLHNTPADALSMSGTLYFREI